MGELNQALVNIRSIRRQVAESTEFRGYGPATLYGTSLLALLAGIAQYRWIGTPQAHPAAYVGLWLTTAILSVALITTQMLTRANRLHTDIADEMVRMAVVQFLPAGVAGAILPFVLLHLAGSFWMLPGLWQILFSLGVFASCRCLPRPMLFVGTWFLLTGFCCLWMGRDAALAPVTMSFAFAPGIAAVALIQQSYAMEGTDEDL